MKKELPHNHSEKTYTLLEHMPSEKDFAEVADIVDLISHSSRLRILYYICHVTECVTNISSVVDMSSPAVSHHLKTLKAAGIIVAKRSGKEVYYSLADNEKAKMVHNLIDVVFNMNCCKD